MKQAIILVLVVLAVGLVVWQVVPRPYKTKENGKISVVTSFYPLYFLAKEIGGEKVEVINVTPAGVEPHDYEPTARDMAQIQQSQMLILNGNKFEAWGEKTKDDLKGQGVIIVETGQGLFIGNDPHVWLSPTLFKKESQIILKNMVMTDPANKEIFVKNEKELEDKLNRVDKAYQKGLAVCKSREIFTSHSAFGYLAKDYGLTQISVAGLTPDEEPSTKQLAEVAKMAREKQVKYIFFESLISPKLAETVAEEVGAKTLVLDPIEGIRDNELAQGKNYITMMEQNLVNLRTALECQ